MITGKNVWRPWPSNPCFFGKSKGFFPKKARVSLFAEPLKSLEKEGKTQEKARKIGKRKKQGNRKKQGLEGQGYRSLRALRARNHKKKSLKKGLFGGLEKSLEKYPKFRLPSDTKLLLTKNYSKTIIFAKITNFTRNSLKKSFGSLFGGEGGGTFPITQHVCYTGLCGRNCFV